MRSSLLTVVVAAIAQAAMAQDIPSDLCTNAADFKRTESTYSGAVLCEAVHNPGTHKSQYQNAFAWFNDWSDLNATNCHKFLASQLPWAGDDNNIVFKHFQHIAKCCGGEHKIRCGVANMCKDPSKYIPNEMGGGVLCSEHSGRATGGLAQQNISWTDANACEAVKTLKNGEVYQNMKSFGPKCCGAQPWELNTVRCFGDAETDTGSVCKVAADYSGTKTSGAGNPCDTSLYFVKEALFKSGKKLSDADACESLKTASRTGGGGPGELLNWMQSDGIFDECCGGDRAKVRCSNSEASGSSASGSSEDPSGTDGTPSGDASICSSVNVALVALVIAVSTVYAEGAV